VRDRRSHVALFVDIVGQVTWCGRAASGGEEKQRGRDDGGDVVTPSTSLHDERQPKICCETNVSVADVPLPTHAINY